MKLCTYDKNCDGLNFFGLIHPRLCDLHQKINSNLTHSQKVHLFHSQRRSKLIEYGKKSTTNQQIFTFLHELKLKNKSAFNTILFYFGEMFEYDDSCSICWSFPPEHLDICKKAFQIICPNIRFSTKDVFCLYWKEKNDMNPIVYDKLIFPDFLFIDKSDLDFLFFE